MNKKRKLNKKKLLLFFFMIVFLIMLIFIKDEKKEEFVELFNKYFSDDFELYTKEDIVNSKLFGDGDENEIFRDSLGDYLAIATSDKTLLYIGSEILKSHHAGYTDDEILVPLIVIDKC